MKRVVAALRRDLLAVLVAFFVGGWIARAVNYVLAPNIYVELEASSGIPSSYMAAIASAVVMGATIGYIVPAQKKRAMNWRFLFSAIALIAIVSLAILCGGLAGRSNPWLMTLCILVIITGLLVLTSQFYPEDVVATH